MRRLLILALVSSAVAQVWVPTIQPPISFNNIQNDFLTANGPSAGRPSQILPSSHSRTMQRRFDPSSTFRRYSNNTGYPTKS